MRGRVGVRRVGSPTDTPRSVEMVNTLGGRSDGTLNIGVGSCGSSVEAMTVVAARVILHCSNLVMIESGFSMASYRAAIVRFTDV